MTYIYESPDNGQTVYRRKAGTLEKELVSTSKELTRKQREQDRWIMWRDILSAANENPVLSDALDRARIIYELGRCDNN